MIRRIGLGLAFLALAGCQSVPVRPVAAPAAAARDALTLLHAWHATGRVGVRTGNDGFQASFDWREAAGRGELGVRGPFGAGAARVIRTDAHIRIESGDAAPVEVDAPFDALERTFTERIGFPLPLDSLRYWLLGVPAPGQPSVGDGARFDQAGWGVAISEYAVVPGAPGPLPARLVLTRASTRIKVIVEHWQAGVP